MFISYAQNFEDVMLWRALHQVTEGVYIDVGANDPVIDSVTKAFYDRGWSGLNIEPVTAWAERLRQQRSRDITVAVAAGAQHGEQPLYDCPGTGLATLDQHWAQKAAVQRQQPLSTQMVPVRTVGELCRQHGIHQVHFLKIDVEGSEADVVRGIDWQQIRPWILVIEAMAPNSADENHHAWEPLILEQGYQCVYCDGLNRYYLAQEHRDLQVAFQMPPNVFDEFIPYRQYLLEQQLQSLDQKNVALEHDLDKTTRQLTEAEHQITQLGDTVRDCRQQLVRQEQEGQQSLARFEQVRQELESVYASKSWRITLPLRHLMLQAQSGRNRLLAWVSQLKDHGSVADTVLEPIERVIRAIPWLRQGLPEFQESGAADTMADSALPQDDPPRVWEIYHALKKQQEGRR